MSQFREKPLVESNEEKNSVSLTKLDTALLSPRSYRREAMLLATSRSRMQRALVIFRKIRAYSLFSWSISAGCKQYGQQQQQNKAYAHLFVYCGLQINTHQLLFEVRSGRNRDQLWHARWWPCQSEPSPRCGSNAKQSYKGQGCRKAGGNIGQETKREICTAVAHIILTMWIKGLPLQLLCHVSKPSLSLSLVSNTFFLIKKKKRKFRLIINVKTFFIVLAKNCNERG